MNPSDYTIEKKLNAKEAEMINILRAFAFGDAIIYRQDGMPYRMEITTSYLLGNKNAKAEAKDKATQEK